MNDQKYVSMPCPNGWAESAGRAALAWPTSRSAWSAVSTTEWIPSVRMAVEPVKAKAANFTRAMDRLPARATSTTRRDPASTVAGREVLGAVILGLGAERAEAFDLS